MDIVLIKCYNKYVLKRTEVLSVTLIKRRYPMSNDPTKKKKRKKHKAGRIFLITFLSLFLILIAGLIGVTVAVVKSSPDVTSNIVNNLKQGSKIYDMNGKYIEDYSDTQIRSVVSLDQIPTNLQNAFISIEDERFWSHHGIDFKRIIGSIWVDIKTRSFTQGASTITQQLVKNVFLTQEKKITRKLQEAYMALQLERKLSKTQILEAYLNTIYLGGSNYGVEAAALNYFGKPAMKLSISQCAFLAGLNKNPLKYYPYRQKNIDTAYINLYTRRDIVLQQMLKNNYINQSQFDEAKNEKLVFTSKENSIGIKYQWFIEPAIDKIADDFSVRYGITKNEAKQRLRVGGYAIYLTIDPKIQSAAEQVINDASNYQGARIPKSLRMYTSEKASKDSSDTPTKFIQPQAAAVIYDYRTGQMRAIVGGRGKHPRLSKNRATDIPRQPGSSIKPLAVYGPAIDTKLVTSSTIIMDSPMPSDFVASHNGWSPHNYETSKFSGIVTIRNAIKNSINIVAIKLANMLNPDPSTGPQHNLFTTSINYLQNKFHLTTIKTSGANSDRGLSPLALGALTEGVYPYEMAAAYGVFGNGGVYTSPILYTKVVDNMGNVVLEATSQKSQSISQDAAYIMVDMMKGVVKDGTGTRASLGKMPAAGKTGTASDNTNLWFCGVTPYYSGAVWLGHDKPNVPLKGLKSSNAAKIWGSIMKVAHQNLPVIDFVKPADLVTASVCNKSGKSPNDLCYKSNTVITDLFIDGTQPIEICDYHRQKQTILQPQTGTDNGSNTNTNTNTNTTNNPDTSGNTNSDSNTTSPSSIDEVPPAQ